MSNNPMFEGSIRVAGIQIVNTDGTTKKTILTGATNGTRIDAIRVCSDDTSAVNLAFYINDGSTDYYIGNVPVASGTGYGTVLPVEALTSLSPVLGYLVLPSGYSLKVNAVSAVTSGKTVNIVAIGGDF
jgi:hypothetical protein